MEGYDSVMLIAKAIERSGSAEPTKITEALSKSDWVGTRGRITFPNEPGPAWAHNQWMDVPVFIIQYTEKDQSPSEAAILWPAEHATVDGYIRPPK
jgi:branched-chain amino acid transport system substrate-binding protein